MLFAGPTDWLADRRTARPAALPASASASDSAWAWLAGWLAGASLNRFFLGSHFVSFSFRFTSAKIKAKWIERTKCSRYCCCCSVHFKFNKVRDLETFDLRLSSLKPLMIERSIVFVLDWILGSCRATIAFLFILLMKKKKSAFIIFISLQFMKWLY